VESLRYKTGNISSKSNLLSLYNKLLSLKIDSTTFLWGLNFPYISRFVNSSKNTPNIYNTSTSGLALAELYGTAIVPDAELKDLFQNIINDIEKEFKFHDEGDRGWYSYYPGQNKPTYNVNSLTAYLFCKINVVTNNQLIDPGRIDKVLNLLIEEQNSDGSWFYNRADNGKWIDGFHTGFIIESLSYIYSHGYCNPKLKECIEKAISYYFNQMFTQDGFPKYYNGSTKYPIESQNCAQAIQTLSVSGLWLNQNVSTLLNQTIKNTIENLYNSKGYFFYKKTNNHTYKSVYFRWAVSPMLVALQYAQECLKMGNKGYIDIWNKKE
jgi:hypothetical protein